MIKIIENLEAFDALQEELKNGVTVMDFYTDTCMPCKMFAKVLEAYSAANPDQKIVKVNLSRVPQLGGRFGIQAVPTIFFWKNGEIADRKLGFMDQSALQAAIGSLN